jgi:glycosyltransferase involved in cell wall biosynthesis
MFSNYPADPRPRRAAEALAGEGMAVEVLCLRENDQQPARETFNGVEITRIPLKRKRGGKIAYVLQYGIFILYAGAILAFRAIKRRYAIVHVHNMPDVLVYSALVPKLLGGKVILDLHDPMPELMTTIFGLGEASKPVRLLRIFEKLSIWFADAVITTNEAFRVLFVSRSCPENKIHVVMNSPNEAIFKFRPFLASEAPEIRSRTRPFVVMYHGSLVERHGLDLAVEALGKIKEAIPGAELRVYGQSTPYLEKVMGQVAASPLAGSVYYFGAKKLEGIAEAIRECDIGVIPNRRSIFTQINMPTRIFEYLSQGKPVIAPHSQGILDYFSAQDLLLFELGSAADLAAKLEYAFAHPAEINQMVERGQKIYRAHSWSGERPRLVGIAQGLVA